MLPFRYWVEIDYKDKTARFVGSSFYFLACMIIDYMQELGIGEVDVRVSDYDERNEGQKGDWQISFKQAH